MDMVSCFKINENDQKYFEYWTQGINNDKQNFENIFSVQSTSLNSANFLQITSASGYCSCAEHIISFLTEAL